MSRREAWRSDRDDCGRGPAVTIKPPFGCRANAAMARSISRGDADFNRGQFHAKRRCTDWITPNCPRRRTRGIAKYCRSLHPRCDLLEQLKPFPAQTHSRTS